jgi:hypothetical protein
MYVEYYADQACTQLLAEGPYQVNSEFTGCISFSSGYYGSLKGSCSSSSDPPLPSDSAMLTK